MSEESKNQNQFKNVLKYLANTVLHGLDPSSDGLVKKSFRRELFFVTQREPLAVALEVMVKAGKAAADAAVDAKSQPAAADYRSRFNSIFEQNAGITFSQATQFHGLLSGSRFMSKTSPIADLLRDFVTYRDPAMLMPSRSTARLSECVPQ